MTQKLQIVEWSARPAVVAALSKRMDQAILTVDGIVREIIQLLNPTGHDKLSGVASEKLGIEIPPQEGEMSKRDRILAALQGKTPPQIGQIAVRAGETFDKFELAEAGYALLEQNDPPITEITRRDA